jgi:peptidoglycan-associated lipoprotein
MNTKNTVFLWTLAVSMIMIFGQSCNKPSLIKADEFMETRQYKSAGETYKALNRSKKLSKEQKNYALVKSAEAYRKAFDFKNATRQYNKLLRDDKNNPEYLYWLGRLTMQEANGSSSDLEKFKQARDFFKKSLAEDPSRTDLQRWIESCDSAESWLTQESRFIVANFKPVNTKWCDFNPAIGDKKDTRLFFTSDREGGVNKRRDYGGMGNKFQDVWYLDKEKVRRGDDKWGAPILVPGEVNQRYNDGAVDLDRKYSIMYFTRCNGSDGKQMFCKIYEAQKRTNEWVNVTMLSFCEEDSANYIQPCITPDGAKMYFSSDREGGYGGYDLYVVNFMKRGKTWSAPVNLGPSINTPGREMFPTWNVHDDHLYFSSDGRVGMGGLDIYKTFGSGQEWTEPENLKHPLNSGADDFGIVFSNGNPNYGFFSSDRTGGKGCYDIYEFFITPLVFTLTGTVTDCKTGLPLPNSLVEITNNLNDTKISLRTDEDGNYDTVILAEKASYEITVTNREAYYFDAEDAPRKITTEGLKKSKVFIEDFCLKPQLDFAKVLPIFYRLDKADIDPPAAAVLKDSLLPLLLKYPAIRIELGSHTDCRSSYAYNVSLSQRRADSAVHFLVKNGVDPRRILAKGYGESQLINDCSCEGRDVTKVTPYIVGKNPDTGEPRYTTKKSSVDDRYVYTAYKPSEISTINGIQYVPCDEFQHSQNRRTTVRILDVNFDSSVALLPSDDPNNMNAKLVILKLEKEENTFKSEASVNAVPPVGNAIFVPGSNKMEISYVELKNLIDKRKIEPSDIIGATVPQITSGNIPPGAKLKAPKLTIGAIGTGKTYDNVELEIANFQASFRFGISYLESQYGATFDPEEQELALTAINRKALEIPVDSKLTGMDEVEVKNYDAIEGVVKIKIIKEGDQKLVPVMVNGKDVVNFVVNPSGKNTWLDVSTAAQLYSNKTITKKEFASGSKFKAQGVKFPSPNLEIEKMEIGTSMVKGSKLKISTKAEAPELGRAFFKSYKEAAIQGEFLYLVPKKTR